MSNNPYQSYDSSMSAYPTFAAQAEESERVGFIRRTYLHLAVAVAAFALIETALLTMVPDAMLQNIMGTMLATQWSWLIVLGAFMGVSWLARSWADSSSSVGMQYAGLGLYVVGQAVIFLPMMYIANTHYPGAITSAAMVTGVIFFGLTVAVFLTKTDFSFLRMFLVLGGLGALGFILAAVVFQLPMLGVIFTTFMIVLACGYILYDTSNVMLHYRTDQHVAAALALFASVALLFWYILRLFMSRR
ncbi:MAG: Bax inhibitor-1 family protein [Pirellulaceae bacterium]